MSGDSIFRLALDGKWDLDDLSELPRDVKQVYSFEYAVSDETRFSFHQMAELRIPPPLRGGYSYVNFYRGLYTGIPIQHRPSIHRIEYSSPGVLDLLTFFAVANGLIFVARHFLKLADEAIDTFDKADRFLTNRGLRRRESRRDAEQEFSDADEREAKRLAFEVAKELQIPSHKVEELQGFTGEWVGTLKLLLAHKRRVERLAEYHFEGKIDLNRSGPVD